MDFEIRLRHPHLGGVFFTCFACGIPGQMAGERLNSRERHIAIVQSRPTAFSQPSICLLDWQVFARLYFCRLAFNPYGAAVSRDFSLDFFAPER
jgi:hypothetical protein